MEIFNTSEIRSFRDPKSKLVFISGVTGQDGSLMVDYILKNTDYQIIGGARRLSVRNHVNIDHINDPRFLLVNFDITDPHSICECIKKSQPDYFINFAAQSFVASSWDLSRQTWETNTTSVLDILEAVRHHCRTCRVYLAGSSEEFGDVISNVQNESSPVRPRSPYAASKVAGRMLAKVYRESYGLYVVQGWLYNHESERRGQEFVSRKISKGIAEIKKYYTSPVVGGQPPILELGNVDAKRDWSYAGDFMEAIWRMLNQENYNQDISQKLNLSSNPLELKYRNNTIDLQTTMKLSTLIKEYVVSSGETHTIKDFVSMAFYIADIPGCWEGEGLDAKFVSSKDILVRVNPKYYRPAEVNTLCGDFSSIKRELGWEPKIKFDELVCRMVVNDIKTI